MALRVYGGWDVTTDDFAVVFRDDTQRGIVVNGRIQYQPLTPGNAGPTLRLSGDELVALRAFLADPLPDRAAHIDLTFMGKKT